MQAMQAMQAIQAMQALGFSQDTGLFQTWLQSGMLAQPQSVVSTPPAGPLLPAQNTSSMSPAVHARVATQIAAFCTDLDIGATATQAVLAAHLGAAPHGLEPGGKAPAASGAQAAEVGQRALTSSELVPPVSRTGAGVAAGAGGGGVEIAAALASILRKRASAEEEKQPSPTHVGQQGVRRRAAAPTGARPGAGAGDSLRRKGRKAHNTNAPSGSPASGAPASGAPKIMTRVRCDNCKCVLQMEIPSQGVTEVRLRCGNCNCLLEVALPESFISTKAPPGTRTKKRSAEKPPASSPGGKVQRLNSASISKGEQEGIEVLLDLAAASSEETASDSPLVQPRSMQSAQPKPAGKQKKRKESSAKHGAPIESPAEVVTEAARLNVAIKQAAERAVRLHSRINGGTIPEGAAPPAAPPCHGGHTAVRVDNDPFQIIPPAAAAPTEATTPKSALGSRSQALAKAAIASAKLSESMKLKATAAKAAADAAAASPSPRSGDLSTGSKGRAVTPKSTAAAGTAPPESLASGKAVQLTPQLPPNKLPVVRLQWNPK